ncbi:carboxymuconolactone decarboxylase family protein [Arenibaculum sp.]|jgi:uncharacterized peroxidase-related enzyme|uniref:carboxymuconolactone decarboxylase family protein n=1 Tax=Arenibaculum sp. TaxID=2865862 RepID=UPI002E15343C|nr:carboxymuconolactone decarboxylase family protein [Arenibaculum sp.]
MEGFPIHTCASAPEAARPQLDELRQRLGFVPNLLGVLAEAPAALDACLALDEAFARTSLGPAERQLVLVAVSRANDCAYCLSAHARAAERAGLPAGAIEAVRAGLPLTDRRLEALRRLADTIVRKRGRLDGADLSGFLDAGWSRAQVLEVLVGVALKTLGNYVDHLATLPFDPN